MHLKYSNNLSDFLEGDKILESKFKFFGYKSRVTLISIIYVFCFIRSLVVSNIYLKSIFASIIIISWILFLKAYNYEYFRDREEYYLSTPDIFKEINLYINETNIVVEISHVSLSVEISDISKVIESKKKIIVLSDKYKAFVIAIIPKYVFKENEKELFIKNIAENKVIYSNI